MSANFQRIKARIATSLFGLCMAASVHAMPPGDRMTSSRDLRRLEFDLAGTHVSLPVPSRPQSPDTFVAEPLPSFDPGLLDRADAPWKLLFSGLWDWDRGLFSDGPRSLSIKLSVRTYPEGISVSCPDQLHAFAVRLIERLNNHQTGSDPPFRSTFAIGDADRRIDGRVVVEIAKKGFESGVDNIIPITGRHYLQLEFTFFPVDRTGADRRSAARDAAWLRRMSPMIDDIVGGLRISGTPPIGACPQDSPTPDAPH